MIIILSENKDLINNPYDNINYIFKNHDKNNKKLMEIIRNLDYIKFHNIVKVNIENLIDEKYFDKFYNQYHNVFTTILVKFFKKCDIYKIILKNINNICFKFSINNEFEIF